MFEGTSGISRKAVIGVVAIAFVAVAGAAFAAGYYASSFKSDIPDYNVTDDNVAIRGYDTVAYFVDGKATKGKSEFEHRWHDTRWLFANATNRNLFAANPTRYAPQYGGYCSVGLSVGEVANADPENWTIVDGKLYLIKSKASLERWKAGGEPYYLRHSAGNWEKNRARLRDNR